MMGPKLVELVASLEVRIVVSFLLLSVTGVVSFVVVPWAVDQTGQFITERVLRSESIPYEPGWVRWFVPTTLARWLFQLAIGIAVGLLLLWVWGFGSVASTIADVLYVATPWVARFLTTVVLLGILLTGTDFIEARVETYAEESDRIGEHEVSVVTRVLQASMIITVGLVTLAVWDFNLRGLLFGAGVLGIIVGMAARQTLSNTFAGFVLMFSRPFEIGDWISIEDVDGTVTDITIVHTRVRTFDGETVVFPNSSVNGSQVKNYSDQNRLRLEFEVTVDYATDLGRAEEIALDALEGLESVRDVPSPEVVAGGFAESGVELEHRFWIENPSARKERRTRSQAIRTVKRAFDENGIEIPYPHRTVTTRDVADGPTDDATTDDATTDDATTDVAGDVEYGVGTEEAESEPPR
ncbi:mechanosensitive ion channel family protein [Haloparvum sp. PAK95]|uniref:mechanosensitive ion channel family protein n=1 Tax=Haloparvum sp. PAK95 TaxID=3418962 RepID=UPI003D2F3128